MIFGACKANKYSFNFMNCYLVHVMRKITVIFVIEVAVVDFFQRTGFGGSRELMGRPLGKLGLDLVCGVFWV